MAEKQVACDCGTTIREKTEDALVLSVQQHARVVHGMDLSREEILSMAEPVSTGP